MKKATIKEWGKAILFAFITIMIFRVFFFEAFTIPSASMERSLLTGDYILVSKLSYGPRLPVTPLSLPFVHQTMPYTETTPSYLDWIRLPYMRLFGSVDVEQGDVVVFNWPMEEEHPVDQRTFYIKRCMGRAGDTLEVRAGQVYINNTYADYPQKIQFNYKVLTDVDSIDSDTLNSMGITEGGKLRSKGEYWFTLTEENVDIIKNVPHVKSVQPLLEKKGTYSDYMFPENEHFLWNVDFYGPLYIPGKGDSVRLTVDSLPLFERIIRLYEENDLRVSHDSIFINGVYATHYTFKMNYYFMMGDNRHNSADSRFWGFVPEDHVVGKAVAVVMSVNKSRENTDIRWDRWFKRVP